MKSLNSSSRILFWGGRSKARMVLHMLKNQIKEENVVIYDSTLKQLEYPFKGTFISKIDELTPRLKDFTHFDVCIGNNYGYARVQLGHALEALKIQPVSIQSDAAYICDSASIGKGGIVMPSATVNFFTTIGNYAILNTGCTIDHECVLGDGVHIMGAAALAGRVKVQDFATIGTNATILPDVTIGKGAYVGAGSVVTKDVGEWEIVAGVPAEFLKKHKKMVTQTELDILKNLA